MGLQVSEQETVITFSRDEETAEVYTSDRTVMTRLDKLVESDKSPLWKLKEEHRLKSTGEIVGKTYETNKRLISFRGNISTREFTEEQKEAAAERMRKWRTEDKDSISE